LSLITIAISASGTLPSFTASLNASMFDTRPEISIAIRFFLVALR